MHPKDAARIANSVDPDQNAPLGAVQPGSALFAQTYLSENLGSLQYRNYHKSWEVWFYHRLVFPKDAEGMANSVGLDQAALLNRERLSMPSTFDSTSIIFIQKPKLKN